MDIKPIAAIEETVSAHASKRFRSLIQELFSLVQELYDENDRLTQECSTHKDVGAEVSELRRVNEKLRETLIYLGGTELKAKTITSLKSEIRKIVVEALKSCEIQEDLEGEVQYHNEVETEGV